MLAAAFRPRFGALVGFLFVASLADVDPLFADVPRTAPVRFSQDVKPLLARRCFACHGPDASEADLRLDRRDVAVGELPSGERAIVPGDAAASAVLARVTAHDESERMPPEGKPLSAEEVDVLRRWIAEGATWEEHWAFVPPARRELPKVVDASWSHHPIDAFILSRLEGAQLAPSARAERRVLARRASFGVTGLPPTEQGLDDFLNDARPDAWSRFVDDLLASPHYGEQWGRHWLDLVRYAETNSFERDGAKPNAWKYRDYVIRSFNADKPYDRFLCEQLAGDELDDVTAETMTATGFYRLGIWDDEPADPLQSRYDELDDLITTVGKAMLGLTINCARCHDHKIDPIPQADYYGMLAFFADVTPYGSRGDQQGNNQWDASPDESKEVRQVLQRRLKKLESRKFSIEEAGVRRMSATDQRRSETHERNDLLKEKLDAHLEPAEREQYQQTQWRISELLKERNKLPPPTTVMALARCEPHPQPTHVLVRGNPHVPGEEATPHFPALFGDAPPNIPPPGPDATSSGRRRVLAEWIASPHNMLTARTIVNRVWQHHFGRGIVRSSSNFGVLGDPPTHPELLDWLALWLMDHHWRLKPLHRLIMTSQAYQMTSEGRSEALAVDPNNDLFWRFDLRRLSAEEVRDAALATSGRLDHKLYGPSFFSLISRDAMSTQSRPGDGWGTSEPADRARRSIYIHVKRSLVTPLLTAFDFPDTDTSCEARFMTTQPGQALSMVNGAFFNEQADALAKRVQAEAGDLPQRQIERALQLALQRHPRPEETATGVELWDKMTTKHRLAPDAALRVWCLSVLNLNEFLYLD